MRRLDRLCLLARYNILTPFAALAAAALAQPALSATLTVNAPDTDGVVIADGDSLVNNSDIGNPTGYAVESAGNVGSITNSTGASISSAGSDAVFTNGSVTTFANAFGADIWGSLHGIYFSVGSVGTFTNAGSIYGDSETGVSFGSVGSFTNSGSIEGNGGIGFGGQVDSFRNEAGGLIDGNAFFGIDFGAFSPVGSFYNAGTITGTTGVTAASTVGTFTNGQIGVINATMGNGAEFYLDVGAFSNLGLIESPDTAVYFGGDVGAFTNAGTITGVSSGVFVDSTVDSFLNDVTGVIIASGNDRDGFRIYGEVGSFSNLGRIEGDEYGASFDDRVQSFRNAGAISGNDAGIYFSSEVSSFVNAAGGSITSRSGPGAYFSGPGSIVIENAGTISGQTGIRFDAWQTGEGHVVNSGTIEGTGGVAIDFASSGTTARDDRLTILTGSRIVGGVNFGLGDDTLDFAGFRGNTVLDVASLEVVAPGTTNYVWDQANGQIAIFDITGTAGVGGSMGDVAGSVNGVIGDQLGPGGQGGFGGPLNYAPARPPAAARAAAESAVLSELDVGAPAGARVWASAFGGRSSDSAPVAVSNVFGGLVAGTHARLAGTSDLGFLGGYVRSQYSVSGLQQVVGDTGLLGLYGRTGLGTVDLSFSLLGGYGGHQTSRDVIVGGVTETARASFSSWFVAPTLGLDVPVLSGEAGDLDIVAGATYVGGSVAGYAETGSSMNLVVGSQTIGAFDGRIGLAGRLAVAAAETGDVSLRARAGFFAQANFGSSTVPVTVLGQTTGAAVAGGSGYGVYAGTSLEAGLARNVGLKAGLDASLRSDGLLAAAASAGIEGTF